ncbi:hypothetical protein H7J86_10350 [Mycobacterium hackensackense]|uniref:endonuclease domain-containing protein n=1 Tax=Mycobacterium hackensackense TaxID=228909 RepID=UPI002265846C|nr:hypothetical protein [Mycobacterium hackensackense]MCV7252562.1 hypothetical protein [Mycobacterium hackensackense]
MGHIVLGTEALATGLTTRHGLRTKYRKLHHNVYAPRDMALDAATRATAAWLWSGRRATLAGYSAAAMLGSRWLPADAPAELARLRQPSPPGIVVHSGEIADDELTTIGDIRCTTAARTCYDMGRRLPVDTGIIRIDALLNHAGERVAVVAAIAERYPGARRIRRLRQVLDLCDPGAESPQETRLRLLLVRAGLPRPVTQIPVRNDRGRVVRRIDMGWPQWMVGVEYDGEQHWRDPAIHSSDIDRLEFLADAGWTIVRVSARHLRYLPDAVITRTHDALKRRRDYGF